MARVVGDKHQMSGYTLCGAIPQYRLLVSIETLPQLFRFTSYCFQALSLPMTTAPQIILG